jgi:ABC-2 type transport system ATP-binding protein
MSQTVIQAENICKSFRKHEVLKNVNFTASKGEIIAICGKNGSGKTVFIRILCGLMKANQGKVTVFGKEIGKDIEFPNSTGIHFESSGLLLSESAFENLYLLSLINGKANNTRIKYIIQLVGLNAEDKRPVSAYSTGMRQRLGIAQALMDDPGLTLLDEPVNGLDFAGQEQFRDLMRKLRNDGKTIIFTSHNKEEIRDVADRALEMVDGRLKEFENARP